MKKTGIVLICFIIVAVIWFFRGERSVGLSEAGSVEPFVIEVPPESDKKDETERQPERERESVELLFAGDVLLSAHVLKAYDQAGGIQGILDDSYRQAIHNCDIFMINQEFPFSDRGKAVQDKQFTFRLPVNYISIFQELGVDIVTLANNHTLDYGRDAFSDTCMVLDQAGIRYVGAGKNLERAKQLQIIEVKGKKIGFLAASRVFPEAGWAAGSDSSGILGAYAPEILISQVQESVDLCDYLVVYLHWGIERNETPELYQRELGKRIIDAGADLVTGAHPHVLQGIEYYNGKPIVYSLGNFIFGSSIKKTMLLNVSLEEDNVVLRLVPGTSSGGYTKELTDSSQLQAFYREFEILSYGVKVTEEGMVLPGEE